jgi:hypothetical protein
MSTWTVVVAAWIVFIVASMVSMTSIAARVIGVPKATVQDLMVRMLKTRFTHWQKGARLDMGPTLSLFNENRCSPMPESPLRTLSRATTDLKAGPALLVDLLQCHPWQSPIFRLKMRK